MLTFTLKSQPYGEEQEIRERALALWLGRSGLPVRTVEDKNFIQMMEVFDKNFIIPPKNRMSSLIESIYQDEKEKYKKRLTSARKITIGLGIWTPRGLSASFLAVSASYFCTVLSKPEHILLGLEQIPHPHTASSIKASVDKCTERWGIPDNKILTVITDNGSNMVAAFRPEEEEELSSADEDEESSGRERKGSSERAHEEER